VTSLSHMLGMAAAKGACCSLTHKSAASGRRSTEHTFFVLFSTLSYTHTAQTQKGPQAARVLASEVYYFCSEHNKGITIHSTQCYVLCSHTSCQVTTQTRVKAFTRYRLYTPVLSLQYRGPTGVHDRVIQRTEGGNGLIRQKSECGSTHVHVHVKVRLWARAAAPCD